MAKKRVFVSFDFDNDRVLKDFVIGQSKHEDSPFEVIDHSLKEAAPEKDWEKKAAAAIARSEIVLVMVGVKTHKASGVLKEIAMARNAGVKIVQVIGYKDGNYTPVPDAGRLYAWNWENLKKLLS
ncbi:MAG: TIR domain-containing protein [Burkholderiales bacterium]|nr:TIR domain-containing protein [Burkholderiales bacterium]